MKILQKFGSGPCLAHVHRPVYKLVALVLLKKFKIFNEDPSCHLWKLCTRFVIGIVLAKPYSSNIYKNLIPWNFLTSLMCWVQLERGLQPQIVRYCHILASVKTARKFRGDDYELKSS